ncbi:MAG: RNA 2',3'-cyclic phosphodiesterase [Candidatus Woesearchaeota archaeon]
MDKKRCFISLDLLPEMIEEVVKIQDNIRKKELFRGKFTEKENIHLTLKFLGEISQETIEKTRNRLKKIRFHSFDAEIKKAGVFSKKVTRIIWLTLGPEKVFELQNAVDDSLEGLFKKEKRFMSHITIARVKTIFDKQDLLDHLDKIEKVIKGNIQSFSLYESELTQNGPIYRLIERFFLE